MDILLVEDHPFQRDVVAGQLMQLITGENTLIFAESGMEALDKILHHKPDIVFCDLVLPDIDGIKLLSNAAERGFMGCVVLTSTASPKVLQTVESMCERMRLNVLGILPKPTSIPLLKYYLTIAKEHDINYPNELLPLTDRETLEAWDQKLFETWFQPIVRFDTGEWVACEALQRLRHPTRGLTLPHSFMPLVTKLGLESVITFSVIHKVLAEQDNLQGRPVGVNISANNLIELNFVDDVLALGQKHPYLNQLIYFELQEPETFEHIAQLQEAASRLLLQGFRIAIDDFGSGHGTLQQVEFLPIDSLKIGLNLVLPMLSSRTALALVEASILVAKRIEVASVAEGIECIEVWHSLREMRCQYGQGYFIAKPMPANTLLDWHSLWRTVIENKTLCPPLPPEH